MALAISLTFGLVSGSAANNLPVELVSVNNTGNGSGNSQSIARSISLDGRYVLFDSSASDIAANDLNNTFDVFARDMQTGAITVVSINRTGTATGNGSSSSPEISADNRYIVFTSSASDLVTNDGNGFNDIFIRDMQTGTTTLLSANGAGTGAGNDHSYAATISPNGRYVAFLSTASDLVSNDTNGHTQDVFVRDLQTGTTKLVSVNSTGTGSSSGLSAVFSANSRFIAFASSGTDLVSNVSLTQNNNIFVRDLQTETTTLVSVNSAGTGSGNVEASGQVISADGRYVAFESFSTNLVPGDNNGRKDVFLRDLQAGTTTLVSINSSGSGPGSGHSTAPAMSANGRYVAFLSEAGNLVSNDTNGNVQDVFVRDMQTGTTTLVSKSSDGNSSGNAFTSGPVRISSDGQKVVFASNASNLITNDLNGNFSDVFIRDIQTGTITLASINSAGTGSGNGPSLGPVITPDALYVAFLSGASDLVANDTNGNINDVFRFTVPSAPSTDRLRFSAPAYSVGEAAGTATITVERTGDLTDTLTTTYSTADGTATAGSDYTSVTGDLTFAPGETSKTFSVPIINDALNETAETVRLSLSNSSSAAVLTITDDDPLPSLSINDVSVTEGNTGVTNANFIVTLSAVSGRSVSVGYVTSPQGAIHPGDYQFANGTLTFAPGETTKTITVLVNGDTAFEGNETFNLFLSNATGATIADSQGICTIVDDDSAPAISIDDVTITEGDTGTKNVTFTVSLSATSNQQVALQYMSMSGTAIENTDYFGVSGGMLFVPGITKQTITVPIRGDLLDEPDETFIIRLSNPINNATISKADGLCTILDNDPPPTISIDDVSLDEGNADGTRNAVFTARLSAPSGKTIQADFATIDGTATAGVDYVATSGSLKFIPGETVKTISVPVKGDTLDENEADETFFVNLSNPANVDIVDGQGKGTIINYVKPGLQLSSASYNVVESAESATVTVERTGSKLVDLSVNYATSDTSGLTPCQTNTNGIASDRCDYATAVGTLRFAAGETTKTIQIPLMNDAYVEPGESFIITLSNPQGASLGTSTATVTIVDNDTAPATQNPIDDQAFFIKQQYVDFLGRVAEPAGFQFWMNRMNSCPSGQICDRIDTSQRFFQSDEFQERGFYVYRLYDAVLGRLPRYAEFVPDVARLNGPQTVTEQRLGKDAYLADFINKTEFRNLYGAYISSDGLSAVDAAGFVNALCQKSGITPASKQSLIDNLQGGARKPAQTLEDFILTPELSTVGTKFYDRGFITMQYFGYLRRDPEQAGFDFWQAQLIGPNAPHRQDYRFMVGGFLQSDEYHFRFAMISAAP